MDRLMNLGRAGEARHQDDRGAGKCFNHLADAGVAVEIGHIEIDQDEVDAFRRSGGGEQLVESCDLDDIDRRERPAQTDAHGFAIQRMIVGNDGAHQASPNPRSTLLHPHHGQ